MYKYLKRLIDFILALIGLIVLSPVFIIICIAIKLDSEGPIFFTQKRIARNKQYFKIIKFRTMDIHTPKDTPTHLLADSTNYITRVGKFLRKTSLDELPQIINILKGDMAIIGPRPCLYNQYDLIKKRDEYGANDIRPGLTGWAQVNGRDELPIAIKAKYDGYYVANYNFLFDCKCFIMTITAVFKHKGVVEGKQN